MQGQFAERISEYVEKPITATAMAMECNGEQAVIVSVDINGISYNLLDEIRKRFGKNTYLLPLCGIAGDQCPVDLVRWVEPESDLLLMRKTVQKINEMMEMWK